MRMRDCEDIGMDNDRERRDFRNEVYANLNAAYNNSPLFQPVHGSTAMLWKDATAEEIATDMLACTEIGTRYMDATVYGIKGHVQQWLDTLP